MTRSSGRAEAVAAALAGGARRTGLSVRGVARWSHNQKCGTNNAMFAAGIDSDRLLVGTSVAPAFGQGPSAIARGARVEAIARRNAYAVTVAILREKLGFATRDVITLDLRHGYPPNRRGMELRARETRKAIGRVVGEDGDAPNIIDGAVLRAEVAGRTIYLEADDVGARVGPAVLHVGEIKGWPIVDGRPTDADKLGLAERQMGIYRHLTRMLVDELGGDVEIVSPTGLLITPQNVGLNLVGTKIDLSRATQLGEMTLGGLPDVTDFEDALGPGEDFGVVADRTAPEDVRLGALGGVLDTLGHHYTDTCLANCPLANFCEDRAWAAHSTSLAGTRVVRMTPGIRSLARVAELADGAPPTPDEASTGAAALVARAGALLRRRSAAAGIDLPPAPRRVAERRIPGSAA